jgi:hypothetical protein
MHHSTTLVVDFDDTLAITLNRDWENATPNVELIAKLNDLYAQGWTVHVVTARGQLSCNGDYVAADKKYRAQIEEWLKKNGVMYTSLSFQKKLAAYYIDDKGITPEDFITKFERVHLDGGWSGADVFYDAATDAVFKTAKNTHSAVEWYKFAEPHYNVPEIYSVIGETIKMEKLFPFVGDFNRVLEVCRSFRNFPPLHPGILPYRYVDRCMHRLRPALDEEIDMKLLETILEYAVCGTPVTFSHGDFSISNIMAGKSGHTVYLIDPINDPTLLSSWIIDMGKLYMSIGLQSNEDPRLAEIESFCEKHDVRTEVIQAHEIGHLCRVYPYAKEGSWDKQIILNRIKLKLNVFRQKINS